MLLGRTSWQCRPRLPFMRASTGTARHCMNSGIGSGTPAVSIATRQSLPVRCLRPRRACGRDGECRYLRVAGHPADRTPFRLHRCLARGPACRLEGDLSCGQRCEQGSGLPAWTRGGWLRRNEALVWEIMARIARHQLISSAQTPPSREGQAVGAKLFAELIDEMADRLAGKSAKSTSDPALIKLRSLQRAGGKRAVPRCRSSNRSRCASLRPAA